MTAMPSTAATLSAGGTEPATGTLWLVPNTLDFGIDTDPPADIQDAIPLGVLRRAASLTHWVAENARTTRAFLKRVHQVVPLAQPLQAVSIIELPRPLKGQARAASGRDSTPDWAPLLAPLSAGVDVGLISEAGLPAVADPGSGLVRAAHQAGIKVVALPGPNSLMLALAASGLQGQNFAFVGYLPVEASERIARLRELEALSRRLGQTQLVIETPYRNTALLSAMLTALQPGTRLSVTCGLTSAAEETRSAPVTQWQARPWRIPNDVPAVFCLLGS